MSLFILLAPSVAFRGAALGACSPTAVTALVPCGRAAVARMDGRGGRGEESRDAANAAAALERAQERAKGYNADRRRAGRKDIPPQTYNILFSLIIVLTLKDLAANEAVASWLAEGGPPPPVGALGAPALLIAYAIFQLAFSFGTGAARDPLRLAVTKLRVTEPPFSSALNAETRDGRYACASCGATLFDSRAKFDSGSGWPAFWRTYDGRVTYERELLGGRMEVCCERCGAHLGHVFSDGPAATPEDVVPPTDPGGAQAVFELNDPTVRPRFCVNGAALAFEPTADETS